MPVQGCIKAESSFFVYANQLCGKIASRLSVRSLPIDPRSTRYGVIESLSVSCGRPTVEAVTDRVVTVDGLRTSRFRIVS